jgi:hypothetical protein
MGQNLIRFQKNSNPTGSGTYQGGVKLNPGTEIYLSDRVKSQSDRVKRLSGWVLSGKTIQ